MKVSIFILSLILASFATTVAYQKTQQAEINYYIGNRYFKNGQFKKAIAYYQKSLQIKPKRYNTLKGIAYSYQWSNQPQEAIDSFRKALSLKPKDDSIKLALAETLSWQKEYSEAIRLYEELVSKTNSFIIKAKLAEVYIWDKQFAKAVALLQELARQQPKSLEVKIDLAKISSWQKDYKGSINEYLQAIELSPLDHNLRLKLAEVYMWNKQYLKAEAIYRDVLKKDPGNIEARVALADIFSYTKNFKKAIALYQDVLKKSTDIQVKIKLGNVLSWDKQYDSAVQLYDEALKIQEDKKVWRQKARVLGWARRYTEALTEYQRIVDKFNDPLIKLEMQAKQAYWDNRVKNAIRNYKKLIAQEKDNLEAMFDLSQIYSYQGMWKDAIAEYDLILADSPGHFRAQEGLDKAKLIAYRPSLKSGYEYFESDSPSRSEDIRRHSFFNRLSFQINANLGLDVDYRLTWRSFSDFSNVIENETQLKLIYQNNPDWKASAYFDPIFYNKNIHQIDNFGGMFSKRILDCGFFNFNYERKRLEDTSNLIRSHYYGDNYEERAEFDINKRCKVGGDYLFSYYSDSNYKHEPGFDILYLLTLDPRRLAIKYRYFYQNFNKKTPDYFSPKGFNTNSLKINWRQFLNKEEIFFGANDLYYDLSYEVTVDSQNIVGNKFGVEINYDLNKSLNFNIKAAVVNSSASVYKDKNIIATLKYYF